MRSTNIRRRQFPDRFLILPNSNYFFADYRNGENCLDVVETFEFDKVAEIYLLRIGAFGFRFIHGGDLGSIEQLKMIGSGEIPAHILDNEDEIVELQRRRLQFANFIAAGFFGRLMAISGTSLSGAQYAAMDNFLAFDFQKNAFALEKSAFTQEVLGRKIQAASQKRGNIRIVRPDSLKTATSFTNSLAARSNELTQADLRSCLSMNYQAAILHERQLSEASLALNFSVAETLINEIFHSYGVIDGFMTKSWAIRSHSVTNISPSAFRKLVFAQKIKELLQGKLIDQHLFEKLDQARITRNNLMHRLTNIGVKQSGRMQTTVRDLWQYFFSEPFELIASISMRV